MPAKKKRSEERRRQNEPEVPITRGVGKRGEPGEAKPYWDKPVRDLYESLKHSGQAQYYQQSDWAMAFLVCDKLDEALRRERGVNGQVLSTLFERLAALGVTEQDRRKMNIELNNGDFDEDLDALMAEETLKEKSKVWED